ncbi:hypothetical protein OG552_10655 [Streptomyces sp. NBC_01476]|uniref:hypothetical protein n=1 Tax=Streptomyces sp. NBC_01476 TaxID=2903881 RepID=UPI002E370355|nr:hypothetical protein [Streptomyces sp. NBC_01476]
MLTSAQRAAMMISRYADSADPDRRTSTADARIAYCLARGVDMDDIDPASGYDRSRRAYESVRASWVWNIKMHGFSDFYGDGDRIAAAQASWAAHRPGFTAGDDWLADAEKAHRAYWEQPERSCSNPHCDFHPSDDHAELLRVIAEMEAEDAAGPADLGPGVQGSLFD